MGLVSKSLIAWLVINGVAILGFYLYSKLRKSVKRYIYARGYGASRGRGMLIVFGRRA